MYLNKEMQNSLILVIVVVVVIVIMTVMKKQTEMFLPPSFLNSFELPRVSYGPFMTTEEVDTLELPRFEPSQWIVNDGNVRPWEARYPIMTIPPVTIPLLGTSNTPS